MDQGELVARGRGDPMSEKSESRAMQHSNTRWAALAAESSAAPNDAHYFIHENERTGMTSQRFWRRAVRVQDAEHRYTTVRGERQVYRLIRTTTGEVLYDQLGEDDDGMMNPKKSQEAYEKAFFAQLELDGVHAEALRASGA